MKLNNLFKQEIKVVNVGLEQFHDDLAGQGIECIQMHWAIPIYRDERISNVLAQLELFDEED